MVVHRYVVLNEASLHHFAYAGHTDNDKETYAHPLLSVGGTAVPRL